MSEVDNESDERGSREGRTETKAPKSSRGVMKLDSGRI